MRTGSFLRSLLAIALLPVTTVWSGEPPFRLVQGAMDAALVVSDSKSSLAWYEVLLQVAPSKPANTSDGGLMYRFQHNASFIKLVEHSLAPPKYAGLPDSAIGFRWLRIPLVAPPNEASRFTALGGKQRVEGPNANGEWTLIAPEGNRIYVSNGTDPGYDIEVGLVVQSMANSARFYGEILGLDQESSVGAERVFWAGRSRLVLRQAASPEVPKRTGVRKEIAGIRFITFPIDDVGALAEILKARGVQPVWGPAPPRPESLAILLFVEDPDGNWVEFYSVRTATR